MKQEALLYFTDTWLTLLGLVLFFSFFIIMLIRVYSLKKEYFEMMSKLPFKELEDER